MSDSGCTNNVALALELVLSGSTRSLRALARWRSTSSGYTIDLEPLVLEEGDGS